MKCVHCQTENPEKNNFCGSCGLRIRMEDSSQVGENIKKIKEEAKIIENQTLGKIQEKAIKWSKVQLIFLSTALSILIVALYYFGYSEYKDLTKLIGEMKENLKQEFEITKRSLNELDLQCREMDKKFKEINAKELLEEMKKNSEDIKYHVKETQNLRKDADKNLISIKKMQNSLVEILIMFDGDETQFVNIKGWLYRVLNEEGFIISQGNIGRFEVDKTEIIYYNSNSQPQAGLIYDILIKKFPGIDKPLHIQRTRAKKRNIQIKLKMTDFRG